MGGVAECEGEYFIFSEYLPKSQRYVGQILDPPTALNSKHY